MSTTSFEVNGIPCSVGSEMKSTDTLLKYIRGHLGLFGTKYSCLEGGCGACLVSVVKSNGEAPQSVNSCLVPIMSCNNWEITTIEKVGNRKDGYHPLQTALAKENGSQCGYCSPGMVMNMYSRLLSGKLTMLEIEQALGSNICRCTGYRPILTAFKKFAVDALDKSTMLDIEDLKICDKTNKPCSQDTCDKFDWCLVSKHEALSETLHVPLSDNKNWYRVYTINDIFTILEEKGLESYMLMGGNTAKGVVILDEYPNEIIDICAVQELKGHYVDQNLVIGAVTTIAELLTICSTVSENDGFGYLAEFVKHINLIAHFPIRSLATIGGNLCLRNRYLSNASDLFILFETVGAQITIMSSATTSTVMSMQAFLKEDMSGKLIKNVILPPLGDEYKLVTYKIMPRAQSVRATTNAGFCFQLDDTNKVLGCRLVYGGLSSAFNRAYKTESYLTGKELFTNDTLQGALQVLNTEMVVVESLPAPSANYRRELACGLLYKCLVSLCPSSILGSLYRSGATQLRDTRGVSEGHQIYDTNPNLWPLNKPIPKIDGLIQCAGEATYIDDMPSLPGEVFAAFVLSKVARGTIVKIDATVALSIPGVIAFYSAADLPGVNSYIPAPDMYNTANELLFCEGEVYYYDQPIGVIAAETQELAEKAADLVEVQYSDTKTPVVELKLAKTDASRVTLFQALTATDKGTDVVKVITGSDTIRGQYHLTMETLVCIVNITEEGLVIWNSSQWINSTHQATCRALGLKQCSVDVKVNRIGGGYGYKLTRGNQVAISAALVAYKLNRPCRFVNPVSVNMRAMGKRFPSSRDFEVGVNAEGVIQYANCDLFGDNGYVSNEPILYMALDCYSNCYAKERWNYNLKNVLTDTPSNTWCRSPGTLEAIAMAEIMLERIAYELNLDPVDVRMANLIPADKASLTQMLTDLKNNAQYNERKIAVDTFNKNNRWKKRGLRFSFLKWIPVGYQNLDVNMSVFADDGTVVITHGGVEMGQGVNTQATQVCAYLLKIPMEKIQIKPNDTVISPNASASGASTTSQNIIIALQSCCGELLARLEPIRKQMDNPTWLQLIQQAYASQVDLQMHAYTTSSDIEHYNIFGVVLADVIIDAITGERQILRVDMMHDVGRSLNPTQDIGQVEGSFIMGLGYWTYENLVFDPTSGELLTGRIWDYNAPLALDIPEDFRVYFRKGSQSSDKIFGSKVSGEPAACLSVGIALAFRDAITQARKDAGLDTTQWFDIEGPFTINTIRMATGTSMTDFKFY